MTVNYRFLILFQCFFIVQIGLAQEFNLEQFYSSSQVIEEFNTSSKETLDSTYNQYILTKNVSANKEELYENFVYQHVYFLDKLNKSGQVFFDNEITRYLNDLKDKILIDHPKKSSIKVLLTDFDDLNAFTNDFGTVYVNVTTVAKLKSEEELMIVLAHEISHVLLEHSFKLQDLKQNLTDSISFEKMRDVSEFELHNYSKNHELEADSLAYQLLSKIGVDLSKTPGLFEKLRLSLNPALTGEVKPLYVMTNNNSSIRYYEELSKYADTAFNVTDLKKINVSGLKGVEDWDFEKGSHPSIEERVKLFLSLQKDSTIVNYSEDNRFELMNQLALRVHLRTLIKASRFIEAWYIVSLLRESFPDEEFLLTTQLKVMLLLTQEKYTPQAIDQIINDYGNACHDSEYLKFRNRILRIPALEMNLLTLNACNSILIDSSHYVHRIKDLAYQFLYKHNEFLFSSKNGTYTLALDALEKNEYSTDFRIYIDPEDNEEIEKIGEMNYVYAKDLYVDSIFLDAFIREFDQSTFLTESILHYKRKRNENESALSIKELFSALFAYEVKIIKNNTFKTTTPILIANIENYFIGSNSDESESLNKITIDNSLKVSENSAKAWRSFANNRIIIDSFWMKDSGITVRDNYMQQAYSANLINCLEFTDVNYYFFDEETNCLLKDNPSIEHFASNINIIEQVTSDRNVIHSYLIIVDVKNQSIAFAGQSRINGDPNYYNLRYNISNILNYVW